MIRVSNSQVIYDSPPVGVSLTRPILPWLARYFVGAGKPNIFLDNPQFANGQQSSTTMMKPTKSTVRRVEPNEEAKPDSPDEAPPEEKKEEETKAENPPPAVEEPKPEEPKADEEPKVEDPPPESPKDESPDPPADPPKEEVKQEDPKPETVTVASQPFIVPPCPSI